jgi:Tfp pilus assembly protein PilF
MVAGCFFITRNWWVNVAIERLARRELAADQPERALDWIRRGALIADPSGSVLLLRARVHRHLGQLSEVKSYLEQAQSHGVLEKKIRLESDLAMAQAGQLRGIEERLPQLLIDADDEADEICQAFVIGYLRTQRFGDALPILKAWIADWPKDPRPLLLRSRIWTVEQNIKRAEDDLQQAHELAPKRTEIAYELAFVLQQENRWREAAALYESCLNHPKWSAKAKLGLGLCHKAFGDAATSEKFLKAAIEDAPDNAEALREYGRNLHENGHYTQAVDVLKRAVELLPYDDELHYLLAQALQLAGDQEAAAPHFAYVSEARAAFRDLLLIKDRLRKEPENVELLTEAGSILLRYSDPAEGVVRLMAALDLEPSNQRARQLLAEYYEKRAATNPEFAPLVEEQRRWLHADAKQKKD